MVVFFWFFYPRLARCLWYSDCEQGHFLNKGMKKKKQQPNIKVNLLFSGSPVSEGSNAFVPIELLQFILREVGAPPKWRNGAG